MPRPTRREDIGRPSFVHNRARPGPEKSPIKRAFAKGFKRLRFPTRREPRDLFFFSKKARPGAVLILLCPKPRDSSPCTLNFVLEGTSPTAKKKKTRQDRYVCMWSGKVLRWDGNIVAARCRLSPFPFTREEKPRSHGTTYLRRGGNASRTARQYNHLALCEKHDSTSRATFP